MSKMGKWCPMHAGRPVVISSQNEIEALLQLQLKIGQPLFVGAKATGTAWIWTAIKGGPQVEPWLWNGTVPTPTVGRFGAINGQAYLSDIPVTSKVLLVCECFEL